MTARALAGDDRRFLRSREVNVPLALTWTPWLDDDDAITSAAAVVLMSVQGSAHFATDVTTDIVQGMDLSGTPRIHTTTVLVGNANAIVGNRYRIVLTATTTNGHTFEESLGDFLCDV